MIKDNSIPKKIVKTESYQTGFTGFTEYLLNRFAVSERYILSFSPQAIILFILLILSN
uniref:Uncharacterized protein n=1 Tax=uncultured Desulfobacterium sp. TaxID=201089 RepID=E1YJM8_9BACT|nr:unknown protein [uncultured Desulfobacterium sp.]